MSDENIFSKVDKKLMDILSLFEQMAVENEEINGRDISGVEVPYNAENYLQLLRYVKGTKKHLVQRAFLFGELYAVKILREMATAYYWPSEGATNEE